ncbi:hypothetical protein J2847_000105 [Azospirillum agricola]|uniref:hypothetical protein n=1 Tax=Azospirillum agricola TaxID=1720247 RepID=UPI001AE172F4|nr:hypothetical protein [Azospirillum agricola]MBP2226838.1 hypothetical protein [Azospirillum agricola]
MTRKPPPAPDIDDPAIGKEPDDASRLTADELAFLLRDPAERARQAERAERANLARTERRRSDPAYAERLRLADRERQRRRRARAAIGRAEPPDAPAAALPDLTVDEAAQRLADHLVRTASPQAVQLRRRPERIRAYAEAFAVYRTLAEDGARPTRGAMAAMLRSRFGRTLTPPQVQKLRDHVEGFAALGGPWHDRSPG